MKTALVAVAVLAAASAALHAHAEVPEWVKLNAGWWADGMIGESEFLDGITFLAANDLIDIPRTGQAAEGDGTVPPWVAVSAGWWADGSISDAEFLRALEHLAALGLVAVPAAGPEAGPAAGAPAAPDSELAALEAELAECAKLAKAYKRLDCEKPVRLAMTVHAYKQEAERFELGPVTYYWKGLGTDGSSFEISPTGQALLAIRMLAENTGGSVTALNCTSPSICAYDVWDGSRSFRYSGMDFTSGQIVLNPGDAREFNILFGPNIGYGGTQFEYDPSRSYEFRISEEFGSASIPLGLG